MEITFSKVIQGLAHPNLVRLYLATEKKHRESLRDYYSGEYRLSHMPFAIRIEPTNKCNLRCVMCPTGQSSKDRPTGFMDMGLYQKIIDEVGKFSHPVWLYLYLGGEPLLHPDLAKMVRMAKDKGLYCRLNTNATLLSVDVSEALLKSGLDCVEFSFDDVSPIEYEAMRRNAKYDKALSNIRGFLQLKKKYRMSNPLVTVGGVRLRVSGDTRRIEVSQGFKRLFEGYAIHNFASVYAHLWAGDFAKNELYQYNRSDDSAFRCKTLWSCLTINWKGDVVACCYDLNYDCILGDVRDSRVADVWNNDNMIRMRQLLHDGRYNDMKLCSTCSLVRGEVLSNEEV